MTDENHIRMQANGRMFCNICGADYQWNMPVPLEVEVAGLKAFNEYHQRCKDEQDEAENEQ